MSVPPAAPVIRSAVRPGSYYDSVVLMQLQRSLAALPGIIDAGVVMATPANLDVLEASGLAPVPAPADVEAGPHDLLIAVKAESETAAGEALARVDSLLQVRRAGGEQDFRPRSLSSALNLLPETRWVLISVPGRHAAGIAREALAQDRHVFLYSDNVSLADEAALKRKALERGLLVMGPDCGTAVIGNAGFGFANRVRRGSIGLVAASGTGLQAVMSRVHSLGSGISQAIGTGGRDLSEDVGGITALQALDLLGRDPETRVIVLISKPPAPAVAARVLAAAQATGKPVVVDFLGAPLSIRQLGNLHFAISLSETAELAVRLESGAGSNVTNGKGGFLRGLFSGGTLAYETFQGLSAVLPAVHWNPPRSQGHTILDLGADEFTVGRLHPMIDQDLRLRRLRQEAADPEVGTILLDVVLGEGAHADPAGELVPMIGQILSDRTDLAVLAVVIGTDEDPQNLIEQIATLERSGARVFRTVDEMVELAWQRLGAAGENIETPVSLEAVRPPLAVVNVGLESFYDSLAGQGVSAVHVDWRPPAGGNEKLAAILSRMKGRE